MGKLTAGEFVTLDGVMQAPGGPDEDREGGFEHGGWSVNYWDQMMGSIVEEQIRRAEAFLLGRKTYQIFAAHWPKVTDPDDPVAAKLNTAPKHVVSRTLTKADWANSSVVSGDVPAAIRRIKDQTRGEIQVSGSANLLQTLLKHDLIDEFQIWVFPLVLGTGKRLFGDGTIPGNLRLRDTKVSTTGVVIQHYERAGKIKYGTFEVDEAGSSRELWEQKS